MAEKQAGKLGQAERDLHGVIAAIATAVDPRGEPDCARSIALARFLLANGCDGLNVLGTTGEATSFSLDQRRRVMNAYAESGLPLDRMMVGTGAAALADAIALTRHAAELGFAGALVLPPFYYKGVSDDGLVAVIEAILSATAARPIPLYLYHFPAQSGLPWHVALVRRPPAATACAGDIPNSVTLPESGGVRPSTMSMVVVLPAPLGPSSATVSPGAIARSSERTARTWP